MWRAAAPCLLALGLSTAACTGDLGDSEIPDLTGGAPGNVSTPGSGGAHAGGGAMGSGGDISGGGTVVGSGDVLAGAALYQKHCASCHGDDGLGTPFGVPLTRDLGLPALTMRIDATMPMGDPAACTGECAERVAAYVQATFVEGAGGGVLSCDEPGLGRRQLRLLTRREYQNTVRDLLGIEPPDVSSLPVEPRVAGFDNNARASVVTSRHADGYIALAENLAKQALTQRPGLLGCSDASCVQQAVRDSGKRAFRRPLTDAEVQRYAALFDPSLTEGSFAAGAELLITALLNSPHFLYRAELGSVQGDGTYRLTPYEVASALSYLYWGTMPDEALMAAADQNALSSPSALRTQAERLLADARAAEQLGDFGIQWLRTDGVLGANKDASVYPSYTDAVRKAQMTEQARLLRHYFLDTQGTFEDLFLTDATFVNSPLANFYGLPDPGTGEDFAQVSVTPASGRGGLLALGAVMAAHAHQNESSPIKRGLFVRDRMLCQHLPDPPANLDTTPPGLDPTLTTRERFALHTSAESCSSCHRFIDGVGFGLEGFDGVGTFRTVENGLPIDTTGNVLGLEGLAVDSDDAFDGAQQLSELIAASDSAQRCLPTQYFRYAVGREGLAEDRCAIAAYGDAFQAADLSLYEMLTGVTQLPAFTQRKDD